MLCKTCGKVASRVRIVKGKEHCASCGGFSEAGGFRVDGILSRQRVRDQGVKYEGDTINPWRYSKDEKAFVPNDDFIKLHSNNAHNFYTPKDLAKTHPKLATKISRGFEDKTEVGHVGSEVEAFKEVAANA